MPSQPSYVQALATQLLEGLEGLTPETTSIVWNINNATILGNRSQKISEIRQILVESAQVFLFDGNIVFEQRSQVDGKRLIPLMQGETLMPAAPAQLSQLFHCAVPGKLGRATYQPPSKVVSEVLNSTITRDQLPRILWYARRPIFDHTFQLCEVGYNASEQILVHADPISPATWEAPSNVPALDRLPPGLRNLFKDFCFDTSADLVNAVALLLTGVLMNHLVEAGKPVAVFNANQKGTGKTLLAVVLSIILDGTAPLLLHDTDDEDELGKRLGAKLKKPNSVLFFDNRKGVIGGSLLESLALAERVSVRQLGYNEDLTRPNDFLWIFTANNARVTTDMTSRAVFISLHYEGDPRQRFVGTSTEEEALKRYARDNRAQILGELLGMIIRWRDAGKPLGTRAHRCTRWATLIGGVLQVAGLTEFLSNQDQLIADVDEDLQELGTLAEFIVSKNKGGFFVELGTLNCNDVGKKATDWLPVLRDAKLRQNELAAATTDRALAVYVGRYFGARIGRPVAVQVNERTGKATLQAQPGRSRSRRYWVEVEWDALPAAPGDLPPAPTSNTTTTTMQPPGTEGSSDPAATTNASLPSFATPTPSQEAPLLPLNGETGSNDLDW